MLNTYQFFPPPPRNVKKSYKCVIFALIFHAICIVSLSANQNLEPLESATIQTQNSVNQKRFRDYTSRTSEFFGLNFGFGISPYEIIKNPTQKWRYSLNIGVLLGYKVFLFTNHFGLRLYGDANLTFSNFAPLRVDYGLNFETLVNFIAKYYIDFGGFVGVRVGGLGSFSPKLTELNPALSAGFRVNIAKHYGVEIMFRTAIKDSQLLQMRKFTHFVGNLRIVYNFDK